MAHILARRIEAWLGPENGGRAETWLRMQTITACGGLSNPRRCTGSSARRRLTENSALTGRQPKAEV